jgi:hypothetical protein
LISRIGLAEPHKGVPSCTSSYKTRIIHNLDTIKDKIGTGAILISSLQLVLRNLPVLLIVFVLAHIPIYVVDSFINQAGLGLAAEDLTSLQFAAGPASAAVVSLILELLALKFTIICCAKVTETAQSGKPVSIMDILRYGITIIGKAILTLTPFFAIYILMLAVAVISLNIQICLGLLLIVPMLLLALFHYLLAISVSIRGQSGWRAYSFIWNLAKDEWQYLTGLSLFDPEKG